MTDTSHQRALSEPILERDEQLALLQSCDLRTHAGFRDYTLLTLLLDTGLRPGEVCGLTLDSFCDYTLLSVVGKDRRERTVRVGLDAAITLWEYRYDHRDPAQRDEQALFLSDDGSPLDVQTLSAIVRAAGKRAGFGASYITAHMLRRTAIARFWHIRQHVRAHLASQTKGDV